MTPVRLEPRALRSRVKHSTTEPLRSLDDDDDADDDDADDDADSDGAENDKRRRRMYTRINRLT